LKPKIIKQTPTPTSNTGPTNFRSLKFLKNKAVNIESENTNIKEKIVTEQKPIIPLRSPKQDSFLNESLYEVTIAENENEG